MLMIFRVVPEKKNNEDGGEVGAGDDRGDAGADDTEHGKAEVAEDKDVIAEEIDEIGSDEGEGDGTDKVHALQGAAEGEVEEKRKQAKGKRVHIRAGEDGDIRGDAEEMEEAGKKPDGEEERRQEKKTEIDAVDEGVVTIVLAAGAEGLGDEGVEADQEAFAEEDEDEEEAGADADGGDGLRGIGEAADHHGVHDGHADPTDLGEDEGKRQVERGAKFGAERGPGEHRLVYRGRWAKVKRI